MNGRAAISVLAGMVALMGAAASPALGAEAAEAPYTQAEAEAVLDDVLEVAETAAPAAAHLTLELRELALALPALRGSERREARAILARPPESGSFEPFGGGWPSGYDEQTVSTSEFVVHWPEYDDCAAPQANCDEPPLADTTPANGIPDYIDQVVGAVEQSQAVQNDALGWPLPKSDGTSGGGSGKLDVYVADICGNNGCVFGYASPEECGSPAHTCSAYLVIDNDYNSSEFPEYEEPGVPLRVTTAHEYNHILQFNIDAFQDGWMFESTATWSEEKTFPADDDYLFYVRFWAKQTKTPLTNDSFKAYGSAVWNHWIENGYSNAGPGVVLDAWEASHVATPNDNAAASYNRALKDAGAMTFSKQFADFATATAEWKTGEGELPDAKRYADVKRIGKLKWSGPALKTKLDNTSHQLINVKPRGASRIKLKARIQSGVRSAVALVGRDGTRRGGTVDIVSDFRHSGRRTKVVLDDAQDYERITAVVVNADGRLNRSGFGYRKNDQNFKLKIR